MAKQNLPSVDGHSTPAITREYTKPKECVETVTCEGYVSRRVDVKLSRDAAIKLRDKTRLLQDTGAKTADGRFVTNRTQTVQWILENEVNL